MSRLASFADEPHGTRPIGTEVQVSDRDRRGLARASPGVVEEQEKSVIAAPLLSRPIRRRQERVDLRLIEITQCPTVIPFERHGPDLAAPRNQLRAPLADKGPERVDRCQPLIARPHAAPAIFLDMIEELSNNVGRDVGDRQTIDSGLLHVNRKWDQQPERVPIAALRVRGEIALPDHVLQEETPYPWAEHLSVTHGTPPWHSARNDDSLGRGVRESS